MKPPLIFFFLIGVVFNVWMLILSAHNENHYAIMGYMNAVIWAAFAIFMTRIAHRRSVMVDKYSKMVDSYAAIVKDLQLIAKDAVETVADQRKAAERKAFEYFNSTGHQLTTPDQGSKSESPRESSSTGKQA